MNELIKEMSGFTCMKSVDGRGTTNI